MNRPSKSREFTPLAVSGPEPADLAAVLASLACDLREGLIVAGDDDALTTVVLAIDDLLGLAASLAKDPEPYRQAQAVVGGLPVGADTLCPVPIGWQPLIHHGGASVAA